MAAKMSNSFECQMPPTPEKLKDIKHYELSSRFPTRTAHLTINPSFSALSSDTSAGHTPLCLQRLLCAVDSARHTCPHGAV